MTGHAVTFLPSPGQEMKQLGDSYARAEFKAHKSAKVGQVCALHVEKGHGMHAKIAVIQLLSARRCALHRICWHILVLPLHR